MSRSRIITAPRAAVARLSGIGALTLLAHTGMQGQPGRRSRRSDQRSTPPPSRRRLPPDAAETRPSPWRQQPKRESPLLGPPATRSFIADRDVGAGRILAPTCTAEGGLFARRIAAPRIMIHCTDFTKVRTPNNSTRCSAPHPIRRKDSPCLAQRKRRKRSGEGAPAPPMHRALLDATGTTQTDQSCSAQRG